MLAELVLEHGDFVGFQVADVARATPCSQHLVFTYSGAPALLARALDSPVLTAACVATDGAVQPPLAVCAELKLVRRGYAMLAVALEHC